MKEDEMSVSEHANYLLNEYGRLQFDYAFLCKPDGESLRNEARNNLEEYIAGLENEVNSVVKKTVTLENKNRNLHKVIAKQQAKIQRQAENLTILLDLYTSGKRSKSHKKLREKYRLLKASFNEWKRDEMSEMKRRPFCGEIVKECNDVATPIDVALRKRIAELEGKIDQLTAHSDIERQDDKCSNDTQTDTFVYGKEREE